MEILQQYTNEIITALASGFVAAIFRGFERHKLRKAGRLKDKNEVKN
jgi:hypothetical protein